MEGWEIGFGIMIVAVVSVVFTVFLIDQKNIAKLETEGCFEKDGVQLTLNDFNRTDVTIKKYVGEFWICPK